MSDSRDKHGHGAACDVERTRLTIVHFSALLPSIRLYFNVYSHEDRMTWSADGSVGTNSVYWKESQVEILKWIRMRLLSFAGIAEEILMSEAMGLCLTLLNSPSLAGSIVPI